MLIAGSLGAQQARHPLDVPDPAQRSIPEQRTRLIMKDGSHQVVLSYKVVGDVVRYRSAERDGETEDVPLRLVDLPATERWKRQHTEAAAQVAVLSPELAKEEAERAALTPEVAKDLRLPELTSVLALDTFHGVPELVPLAQQGSDLNRETAHDVQKLAINPASSAHRVYTVMGYRSDIQLHVAEPVFYVRLGEEDGTVGRGGGMTVETHGQAGRATPSGGADQSGYVIERLDVRNDSRVVDSFRLAWLGNRKQQDVIEVKEEALPGGHWLKLTPLQPLDFGEYALIEIVSGHEINLDVWDFGIHSDAKENAEALRPEARRPVTLERRRPE